jgi:dipeptidyl aminopeptidase/acylaminoacyl peptidase
MKSLFTLWIVLVTFVSIHAQSSALKTEDFSQLPDVSSVQLSPDGKKLASFIRINTPEQKGTGIQVTELGTKQIKIVLFSDNTKYFLNSMYWKDEKTLLVTTFYPSERDTWTGMRQAKFKTRDFRLMIVDTETGEVKSPFKKNFFNKYKILPSNLHVVLDSLPDDPDHIIMQVPGLDNGWSSYPALYKVNIKNQKAGLIQPSIDGIRGWVMDQQQNVRIAIYMDANKGIFTIRHRSTANDKWKDLWSYKIFSEDQVNPIGFGPDANTLYITAYHQGRMALFQVNLQDAGLTKKLILADPDYDIQGHLVYSPKDGQVIGIDNYELGGTHFFDSDMQQLKAKIDKALPGTKNYLYTFSKDLQKFIVFSFNSQESGTYYLGQRNPTKLDAVAYRYKKLLPNLMAKTERIEYKARDGLLIEAYLTLPQNKPAKKLPTLMFPHGGPIGRDSDGFDYWAQFFVNKGYAVLQMNFRGSDGQGIELRNAGLKNWGKEMQDDIEDGAKKLIADGIADPESIAIVGASYGGYAALMGVVKTPDFYQCAISVNGVSNVYDLVKDNRAFWLGYNVVDEQIGNDNANLKSISPVNHADKIKVPVLLIHGADDRQVEIKHSYEMRDALEKAGKQVTFLELPHEDHYLTNEQNRMATFKTMDKFLDECKN